MEKKRLNKFYLFCKYWKGMITSRLNDIFVVSISFPYFLIKCPFWFSCFNFHYILYRFNGLLYRLNDIFVVLISVLIFLFQFLF